MSNLVRLNSISSSYIELLNPSSNNCKSNKLIVGTFYNKSSTNKFFSIINFKWENIENSNIDSAYLYIYLDSMECSDLSFKNIFIYENTESNDLTSLQSPPVNLKPHIDSCIPFNFVNHYVNINITSLYKFSNKNKALSIVINSNSDKNTSIVKFQSSNSLNPPYIILNLKNPCKKISYNDTPITKVPSCNSLKEYDYDKVNTELSLLNKQLDELKKEVSSLTKRLNKITIEPINLK